MQVNERNELKKQRKFWNTKCNWRTRPHKTFSLRSNISFQNTFPALKLGTGAVIKAWDLGVETTKSGELT